MSASAIPFRPRSVSELVDAAFQVLRRGYAQFLVIMGIAYVPWLVVSMIVTRSILAAAGQDPTALARNFSTTMLLGLGAMVWFSVIDGALTLAASESYLGRPVDVGGALGRAFGRALPLVVTSVVRTLLTAIGFMLFIFPAFWAFATFFASPIVVMLERRGAFGALGRSSELTRGEKWHVLKTLLLVWVIYFVLSLGLNLVMASIFGSIATGQTTLGLMATQIAAAVYTILAYPLISVVQTLLYYDLRIRKEGYDIELMANELGGDGGAARPAA